MCAKEAPRPTTGTASGPPSAMADRTKAHPAASPQADPLAEIEAMILRLKELRQREHARRTTRPRSTGWVRGWPTGWPNPARARSSVPLCGNQPHQPQSRSSRRPHCRSAR